MEIKLIKRELKNGRTSLVLEYYLGYTLGANGTTRPKRKFETLEYFLYTTPRNKAERDHNKINLEMAEKVKANKRVNEVGIELGSSDYWQSQGEPTSEMYIKYDME